METCAISFIDYGDTRGLFTFSLANATTKLKNKINFTHVLHQQGSNIAGNRNAILNVFVNGTDADWLLCLDTDIIFTPEQLELLWETKSQDRQVVSGVYFIIRELNNVMPMVMPTIFQPTTLKQINTSERSFYHPLPVNEIVEISRAGFGFLLISRKVAEQVLGLNLGNPFEERHDSVRAIVGEDFVFFEHLENLKIKSYAHTGIVVGHDKTIQIGYDYYKFYNDVVAPMEVRFD